MTTQEIKQLFTDTLIRMNVAVFLYKIEIEDYGDGHGVVCATNDAGAQFKAYYNLDYSGVFTEWEMVTA